MADVFEKFPFLKEKQNEFASNLSGGQQQMLAIGRALVQAPKLLLLDEPSLGLAPKAMKEVFKKIADIRREGIAVIIVEQNVKQAVAIADRIYVLENGEVALQGDKSIFNNEKLKRIYFGGE